MPLVTMRFQTWSCMLRVVEMINGELRALCWQEYFEEDYPDECLACVLQVHNLQPRAAVSAATKEGEAPPEEDCQKEGQAGASSKKLCRGVSEASRGSGGPGEAAGNPCKGGSCGGEGPGL